MPEEEKQNQVTQTGNAQTGMTVPPVAQNIVPETNQRITELEGLLAAREETLKQAQARLAELEHVTVEAKEQLTKLGSSYQQAVASYKALVNRANPEVLPELLSGETIEAVDESLTRAKELIGKVKSGLEAQAAVTRIPPGAPQRTGADSGSLSAREKIMRGIGKRG